MRSILSIYVFLFYVSISFSQEVNIHSINNTYKGKELVIYSFSDFITKQKNPIDTCFVHENGEINFQFSLNETQQLFIEAGIFLCNIYVEPNENYEIILPDHLEKSIEEKLNPFFEPVPVYVGIKNERTNLNKYIRAFDEIYEDYINDYKLQLLLFAYQTNVDTFILKVDSLFGEITHPYFKNYKYYKFAQLRNLAYERNTDFATKEYLLFKPFLYHNVAYTSFFNQLYNNYFDQYSKTKEGNRIYYDISYSKSITAALETLDKNIALANDTLRELVLIKGLHDAFLNPDWPTPPLLQTLDSVIIQTRINEHRDIAENIKKKVTKLRNGFKAPDFELYSPDSILKSLADYNGKFIYLNFCTAWSFDCQKQFEAVKELQNNYAKYLNVVTISGDEKFSALIDVFEEKNYGWDLLHFGNDEKIIEDYNIKVFPMYYLIDPQGKLIMNPAPSPEEHFEQYFIDILKAKLRRTN